MSDDTQIWIDLGGVLEAHRNRAFLREKVKAYISEHEMAIAECSMYGMYEDCGPSYDAAESRASGQKGAALSLKISFEKNFKERKLSFLEKYGMRGQLILMTHLPGFQVEDNE